MLAVTRDTYMDHDFAGWSERFHLPNRIETFGGERVITTPKELRSLFDSMQAHFEAHDIIDLKRHTIAARFLSATEMESTFISQHVMRSLQLSDQIVVHSTTLLVGGLWRVATSRYATNFDAVTKALMRR